MAPFRAPAGTVLGGVNVGGRYMSFVQTQTAIAETRAVATARGQVILNPIYSYESRMDQIDAALLRGDGQGRAAGRKVEPRQRR